MSQGADRPLRVAILGCGGIADTHCRGYRAQPGVEIVALADVNPEALERFGEQYGVPGRYIDYHMLLQKERPDIVSVCTWPDLHAPMVVAAAELGIAGVLCEKPLSWSLGEVDRMIAACRAAGT